MRAPLFVLLTTMSAAAQQTPAITRLEGRVTDQRGEPIPLAEVWAAPLDEPEHVAQHSRCDGQGLFLLPRVAVDGPWWISATANGKAVTTQYVGRTWGPSHVRLHEAARVTGVVRDRDGKPVAKAAVRASLVSSRLPFGAGDDTVADEHGVFVLTKAPLGEVTLVAIVAGGFASARLLVRSDCEVQVAADASATTELHVEVTGLDPARLRGVHFELRPYDVPQSLPAPWARPSLDEHGRCDLVGLPDQQYVARFAAPGIAFAPREFRLGAGQGPHRLAVTAVAADAATQEFSGVLCSDTGALLRAVRLVLRDPSNGVAVATTTDEHGAFRFDCPWPKGTRCWVAADDERFVLDQDKAETTTSLLPSARQHHETVFDPASSLRLCAVAACQVTGRVLQPDGTPAMLATVELQCWSDRRWPAWACCASATTDANGRYTIRGVHDVDGPVRIAVQDEAGVAEGAAFALDRAGTHVQAPELRLSKAASIQGVVRTAAGEVQPGVAVWLRNWDPAAGTQLSGAVTEVLTDRDGRYRFLGVPPGGAWLQFGDRPTTFPLNRPLGPGALKNLRDMVPAAQAGVGDPFEVKPGESIAIDLRR